MIDRFDRENILLKENGWFKFIDGFQAFWNQFTPGVKTFANKYQLHFEPITLNEFSYPMTLFLGHIIVFTLIFIGEIMWYRIRGRCWRLYKKYKQKVNNSIKCWPDRYRRFKQNLIKNIRKIFHK